VNAVIRREKRQSHRECLLDIIFLGNAHAEIDPAHLDTGVIPEGRIEQLPVGNIDKNTIQSRQNRLEQTDLLHRSRLGARIDIIADLERAKNQQDHAGG